ncbi:uncharacterized protein LOC121800832 [Salvia splendens]|uniref:uncharacterized protein LOC121800832 n=1 Tax=Salvia splendens TaxID=180675 RepID=UPI001C25F9A3|nr:uncharacterized protein LOC121800832 [Salvia splendens]
MYEVRDPGFPTNFFSFKPFGDIASNENEEQTLFFDIIGVITAPGRVVKQSRYRLIEVEISDEHHNKILCTIWDSNVDFYLFQLKKAEGTVPIIIVQFCKANVLRGEIGVSTYFQASIILINADMDEVKEFRQREFDDLDVKSISDVVYLVDGSYWVFDKVESIESHFGEWFRFVVNIVDDTSNASLLLWNGEAIQLIAKRVTDLIGSNMENNVIEYIPRKIEELLLGQEMLFKVQRRNSKEYYRRYLYTVNKICNIPDIVEKLVPLNIGSQVFNSDVKLVDLLFGADIVEGFVTPNLSVVTKADGIEWIAEGSVKRCLEDEFDSCDDVSFR